MQVKKADARLDQSGKMDGANYLGRRFLYVHATLSTQASNRNLPWKFVDPRQGALIASARKEISTVPPAILTLVPITSGRRQPKKALV
jgi:hypothetical protein